MFLMNLLAQATQPWQNENAVRRIEKTYSDLPEWLIPNPFVVLIVLLLLTLAAVVWLGIRQKQIAENQRRLSKLISEVGDRVDEVLDELDKFE